MRIDNLHIHDFGVFHDTSFKDFGAGLNVIFGRNETGKTTLMHFLRGMLYGFTSGERSRYLAVRTGLDENDFSGGEVEFSDGTDLAFQLQRSAWLSEGESWSESTSLGSGDVDTEDPSALARVLGAIDEATFVRIYAIGLSELQELNLLGNTEAAQLIYRLTSGIDRVSLFDILDEVNQVRRKYLSPDGQAGILPDLHRKLEAAGLRVSELERRGGHWARLANRRKAVADKIKKVEDEVAQLDGERRTAEVARRISSEWEKRKEITRHVESLAGQVPAAFVIFSDDPVPRLNDLEERLAGYREELDQLRLDREILKADAEKLLVNRELVRQRGRIEAIAELSGWIANLEGQQGSCRSDIARMEEHLSRSYGLGSGESTGTTTAITGSVITSLRGPARQWREQKQRVRDCEQSLQQAEQEAEVASQLFDSAMADAGCSDLSAELENTARRVALLRRQGASQERLSHLRKNREEVVAGLAEPSTAELLSPAAMIGVGSAFVIGFMALVAGLVFGGWLGMAPATRGILAISGIGGLLGAVGGRFLIQRNNVSRLSMQTRQLELLSRQETECVRENEEVELLLGPAEGGREEERAECDRRMSILEMIVPLEAGRRAAIQKVESNVIRLEHAQASYDAAEDRWAAALEKVGLPATLLPRHIRQYSTDQKHVQEQTRQLDQRKLEFQRCEMELDSLRRRIEQVYVDSGVTQASTDLPIMLRELTAALAHETRNLVVYRSLAKKDRKVRKRITQLKVLVEELGTRRNAMFTQTGCADENEFRSQAESHGEFLRLRSQLRELDAEIDASIGNDSERAEVEAILDDLGENDLGEAIASMGKNIGLVQKKRDELNQRAGTLDAEMQSLEDDRSLAGAQLELSELKHECERASQCWRSWEATRRVLGIVRDEYESHRQPETLQEASRWLQKMTGGRYTRVWTPMDEDALLLDDASDQVWPLESLSSGTRETVYLALRLALIEGYRNRGVVLPVVLDDILVNFDAERTELAIEAICEFAEMGHQVLFFTCHAHVNDLFSGMGIDSRILELRPAHPPRLRGPGLKSQQQEDLVEANIAEDDKPETEDVPEAIRIRPVEEPQVGLPEATEDSSVNDEPDDEERNAA